MPTTFLNYHDDANILIRKNQGRGKLGGTTIQGQFLAKGAIPDNKKGISLFIAKSWGQATVVTCSDDVIELNYPKRK